MRRVCALIVLSSLMTGCVSDGKGHWYDAAVKDAKGENQKMRGFPPKGSADE